MLCRSIRKTFIKNDLHGGSIIKEFLIPAHLKNISDEKSLKSRSKQRNGFSGGCFMVNPAAVDFSSSTFWMLRSPSNERNGHNTIQTKDNEK